MPKTAFEWDPDKDNVNRRKHGIPFSFARRAFWDPRRVIARDLTHSDKEERYFCFREIEGGCNRPIRISGTYHQDHWRRILAERKNGL